MAKTELKTKLLTYEEYLKLPLIEQPYEIIDGEMRMSPAPTSEHQWYVGALYRLLCRFVEERDLGYVFLAPLDVIIQKTPKLKTRQPDILYLSAERSGIQSPDDLDEMPQIDIAPDLAVEMLSPDEPRRELPEKLTDYAKIGVLEVWMISSEAETAEVLKLERKEYIRHGLYGRGDKIDSIVLKGIELSLDDIFATKRRKR